MLEKHVGVNNLNTAQLNKDWGCLEFNDGVVDIDPKTSYRYAASRGKSLQTTENKDKHLPITQLLIGLLKGSNLDVEDYKQYLEDKYL